MDQHNTTRLKNVMAWHDKVNGLTSVDTELHDPSRHGTTQFRLAQHVPFDTSKHYGGFSVFLGFVHKARLTRKSYLDFLWQLLLFIDKIFSAGWVSHGTHLAHSNHLKKCWTTTWYPPVPKNFSSLHNFLILEASWQLHVADPRALPAHERAGTTTCHTNAPAWAHWPLGWFCSQGKIHMGKSHWLLTRSLETREAL